MISGMRHILRSTLRFAALASLMLPLLSAAPTPASQAPDVHSAAVRLAPEVRLRKLHLVRPDLIPYPIAYEVYC
jgi:hypothetical protein